MNHLPQQCLCNYARSAQQSLLLISDVPALWSTGVQRVCYTDSPSAWSPLVPAPDATPLRTV